MTVAITRSLDLKGVACPLPIVKTANAMKDLAPGALVEVLATDPGSVNDFAAWARTTGNELLESSQLGNVYRFVIRKKG